MSKPIKPRDTNAFAACCADCGNHVEAQAGFLYRYSGANLPRVGRYNGRKFTYVVRCVKCAQGKNDPRVTAALAPIEESNVMYQAGYAYACGYHD